MAVISIGLAIVLLVPGGVLASTEGPVYITHLYQAFSNVTPADFDLLEWGHTHLPHGARVLVAPGSAGQFLPAYAPHIVLLYPMTGAGWRGDSRYVELRDLLANATLGTNGTRDLAALAVQFIVVTGNSSVLYPAFSPLPFVGDPAATVLFEEGSDYVFEWRGGP